MKNETIRAIFTNVLFVVGVILLIVGFVRGSSTIAKLIIFDKYPLDSYEETRCEYEAALPVAAVGEKTVAQDRTLPADRAELKAQCKVAVERNRDVRQLEDTVGSISMLVSGAALVLTFKRFIFHPLGSASRKAGSR